MNHKKRTHSKEVTHAFFLQRRFNAAGNHLRPQRWNWSVLIRPLDQRIALQTDNKLQPEHLFNLRYFWLDGLFAAISDNFHLGFIPLFALALGAGTKQIGLLAALVNLLGAMAFFPGARLTERVRQRKRLVLWTGGGVARFTFLGLALLPLVIQNTTWAIWFVIVFNSIQAFMGNLANPAWTAIVADLVPEFVRGRYFGGRSMAMGVAALLIAPLAGFLIDQGNLLFTGLPHLGFQTIFFLAFAFGMISTFIFGRIQEPKRAAIATQKHQKGDLWRVLKRQPTFIGFVASAFIWNLALFVAAPFFNVFLVQQFQTNTAVIGILAAVSSLTALFGQRVFGPLLDRKSNIWVQVVCGFTIPILPFAWVFITASWQVAVINAFGGFIWAGYLLSNFNLLLKLAPEEQRPRAVALYQTAVFSSAFFGPILGGYLAETTSFQFIFGISGAGRLLAMIVFAAFVIRMPKSQLQPLTSK